MTETSKTKPLTVTVASGRVMIDGPGVAVTLDPRAARETADALHEAAAEARRQELDRSAASASST